MPTIFKEASRYLHLLADEICIAENEVWLLKWYCFAILKQINGSTLSIQSYWQVKAIMATWCTQYTNPVGLQWKQSWQFGAFCTSIV